MEHTTAAQPSKNAIVTKTTGSFFTMELPRNLDCNKLSQPVLSMFELHSMHLDDGIIEAFNEAMTLWLETETGRSIPELQADAEATALRWESEHDHALSLVTRSA